MKLSPMIAGAISCLALTACGPSEGDGVDANLQCAALISAASELVRTGKAENDPVLGKQALGRSMLYLNAYAIPKKLKEPEAFAEVKSLRAKLIDTRPPAEIMDRAKRCVDRSPR